MFPSVFIPIIFSHYKSSGQSCLTLCNPMNRRMPGLPCPAPTPGLPKPMSIELVVPSSHLILCRPLLLLPSIFPSIRVFSNESALCIRWPKYWSFSFNISPQSWTVKKAECQRIDAFELWCWRRLLRVHWTARRSNQSILKEISPGCSLEGLMLGGIGGRGGGQGGDDLHFLNGEL